MADINDKSRGNTERGAGSSSARAVSARSRATSQRQTGKLKGNPGTFIGREQHGDVIYARYEASRGTWVSASLAERGYDQKYGRDVAFGAYLGIAVDSELQPLKNPDRIEPGLQYLIPIGPADQPAARPPAPAQVSNTPLVTPQTALAPNQWKEEAYKRVPKDLSVWAKDMPYPSFELNDDQPPPNREPRAAVAYWLRNHSLEIAQAERHFNVSRIAIAGAIAWEALNNPQVASLKAVGAGKMHLQADPGDITWAEAVENAGKMPKLTPEQRREKLRDSRIAIFYIAAAFDLMCEDAEKRGFYLRSSTDVLGFLYHAKSPGKWAKLISTKPLNESWLIPSGGMGEWIGTNQQCLEQAVGKSGVP